MKIYLKICENPSCGEVIGAFQKKICKFCGGKEISTHTLEFKLVLGDSTPYTNKHKSMCVLRSYKGANHVFIREQIGEGNDCDHNGGYTHIPCISDQEADELELLILSRISKEGDYL